MSNAFSFFRRFAPQDKVVGCSFDGSLLRQAVVRLSGASIRISKLQTSDTQAKKSSIVASCLASSKTLARPVEIALQKRKDVDAAFIFEAEAHLPYPLEQCLVDKVYLASSNGASTLQMFATLKTDLQEHLDKLQQHQLDPEQVLPKPLALCHFVKRFCSTDQLQIVIDIDSQETTCVLIKDGLPLMARSHPIGLKTLESVTRQDETGQPVIVDDELTNLHNYLREISRILLSFNNVLETSNLPLLFMGPVVQNQILIQLFGHVLKREIVQEHEMQPADGYSCNDLLIYAAPIGAALGYAFEQQGQSVNFRKDEFAFGDKWRRWKKELAIYFCLMLLLSIGLFAYFQADLSNKRLQLVEKYAQLLHIMDKNSPEQELIALSPDEIDDKLYDLEKELKASPEEMALHPDIPRASDVLAWLASHPNVVINGEDAKALKLESLAYTMVKRPEKGKLKEHYQVRIDIEFSSPSATMAREFHDALLAPNAYVDPKNELKWSVHRGRFRASFFLKDRTKYPQEQMTQGLSL